MGLRGVIFGETRQSSQEITIGKSTLNNIRWINTIENKCFTALIFKMIGCPSPIVLDSRLIVPSRMTLMTSSIYKQSLWPVRERWVTPWSILECLVNNLLPWQRSKSAGFIWELVSPVFGGTELSE